MSKVTIRQPNGATFTGCECLEAWWPVFTRLAVKQGLVKSQVDVAQGSYSTGVAASAGTHAGGGTVDLRQYTTPIVKLAREMGAAAWHRTVAQGFDSAHCHLVLVGCPHNGPALYQVSAYLAGYNGLGYAGRKAKDDGPRGEFVGRTYSQGITWGNTLLGDWFDMATEAQLRKIIREELDKPTAGTWAATFGGVPAMQHIQDAVKSAAVSFWGSTFGGVPAMTHIGNTIGQAADRVIAAIAPPEK